MANIDAPFGLRPVRTLDGNPWNGQVMKFCIAAAVTNIIGINEAILWAGSADADGVPTADLATATDGYYITGVVCGFKAIESDLSILHRTTGAKSIDYYCYACVDPDAIFEIQDDAGATLTAAYVGLNAEIIRTHTANTTTGISGTELDAGTSDGPASDASNQLLILAAAQKPNNSIGDHCVWDVLINMHSFRTPALGV